MNARFGPGATHLSGLAAQLFGWRPAEFWAATPAELAAVLAPGLSGSAEAMTRTDLNRLMERDDA
ncbi:MAG: phage tail assembly chaperone [Novosphingobium sp.]